MRRGFIISFLWVMLKLNTMDGSAVSFVGEYLYFRPILDDTYYAFPKQNIDVLEGTNLSDQYEFSSGYRVEGRYFFCDRAILGVRWSSLKSSHQETFVTTFADPVPFPSPFAPVINVTITDLIELNYQSADAFMSFPFQHFCIESALSFGVHYINVFTKQNTDFSGVITPPLRPRINMGQWMTEVSGVGPELALSGGYYLPKIVFFPNIQLIGSLQIGALIIDSDTKSANAYIVSNAPLAIAAFQFSNEEIQRIVSFFDLRLGIESTFCLSCFSFEMGLGYEALLYRNLLNRTISANAVGGPTFDFYSDLFFHGLFVRLGIAY
jgi:hypothetical protein